MLIEVNFRLVVVDGRRRVGFRPNCGNNHSTGGGGRRCAIRRAAILTARRLLWRSIRAGEFYEAYLDVTAYLSLTTGALLISTRTDDTLRANSSAADRLAYLTIEELATGAGNRLSE